MGMTITIKGIDLTKEHLVRFRSSMADMTETMGKIGETLAKYYSNEPFVSRGGVYNRSWQDLAPATQTYKSLHWPGRGPLVRSGDLQDGFGYTVTPLSATIRNSVKVNGYSLLALQQNGTSRGIPPRLVMALNTQLEAEVTAIVHEDVAAKVTESA